LSRGEGIHSNQDLRGLETVHQKWEKSLRMKKTRKVSDHSIWSKNKGDVRGRNWNTPEDTENALQGLNLEKLTRKRCDKEPAWNLQRGFERGSNRGTEDLQGRLKRTKERDDKDNNVKTHI